MNGLGRAWFDTLPDSVGASARPCHQPFFVRALSQTMRMLEDPDWEVLDNADGCNFSEGVPVGHLEPLPNVPQVFEPKRKETKYDQSELRYEMSNYNSVAGDVRSILEEQFQEEEKAGRMFPLSLKEARARYPGSALRIAAQGVLEKPGGGYRVIHDATHGVQLSNEIKIDNQMSNPCPREPSTVLQQSCLNDERVIFGIAADISKALTWQNGVRLQV